MRRAPGTRVRRGGPARPKPCSTRYAQIMASAVLGGLPLLIVFALFQRHVVRGVGDAGIKG